MELSSAQWDTIRADDEGGGSPTPRLVLDEARLDANLRHVAARARALGARLRPHIKTHKSPDVLERQLAGGIDGVTAATIREAELAVECGVDDVLLAFPPVGEWRLRAIDRLLDRARVVVACAQLEHVEALARLERPVECYWELESGTGRLGTPPGEATAAVLQEAGRLATVRLAGLMTFGGHAYAEGGEALRRAAARESEALRVTAAALRARGIDPGVLSCGTTPLRDHPVAGATEYRFGNYVFLDATQVALGVAVADDCALTVEATVVGRPADDRLILDAGSKALAAERMTGATGCFGLVRDHPELLLERLYEEHGICRVSGPTSLTLGDRVEVIPNHACTCANLHEAYAVRLAAGGEASWPVVARGWHPLEVTAP